MQRAMAKQAAEREKRAKIIAAEGEALSVGKLAEAADVIANSPIALQLRNLQVLAEIAVEKNSTIAPPAVLRGARTAREFLAREGTGLHAEEGDVDPVALGGNGSLALP